MTDEIQDDGTGAFALLGLNPALCATLDELGYDAPTPIQAQAIPPLLAGEPLLGLAATGTGKTAAFALPLLQRLASDHGPRERGRQPRALILVPTRELAMQVTKAIEGYAAGLRLRALAVYGGSSFAAQKGTLRRGVDVVVATPGRAKDHLQRGSLDLTALRTVVLDEADEMLDMGFAEDIEEILDAAPAERQMVLFSATLPDRLRGITERYLRDATRVELEAAESRGDAPRVRQCVYLVRRGDQQEALARILELEEPDAALVFCRTRVDVDELTEALQARGLRAEALHGGLTQAQRDRVMQQMRREQTQLLVATDVAARGIDLAHLTHVVNVGAPESSEQYVHRIGRTGRAGREGTAITLLQPRERYLAGRMERHTGQPVERAVIPTADELRGARLKRLRKRVARAAADASQAEERAPFRDVVSALVAKGTDPIELAATALQMAHAAAWAGEPESIAQLSFDEPARAPQGRGPRASKGPRAPRQPAGGWARLFVNMGRQGQLRPGDLVGAITGETGLPAEAVGKIEIATKVSFVEVRASEADRIISALSGTALRGRKVLVRRDRNEGTRARS